MGWGADTLSTPLFVLFFILEETCIFVGLLLIVAVDLCGVGDDDGRVF